MQEVGKQGDAIYKPRLRDAKVRAIKSGDLSPVVGSLAAVDASSEVIEREVTDVTVSSVLRTAMGMPSAGYIVSGRVASNAEAIGNVLLDMAIRDRNMQAIREVLNRTEGKVANRVENMSASLKLRGDVGSIGELMARIDKNKGE